MRIRKLRQAAGSILPGIFLLFILSGADVYLWQAGVLPLRPALVKAGILVPLFGFLLFRETLKNGAVSIVSVYRANTPFLVGILFLTVIQTVWVLHAGAYWEDGGYLAFRQLTLFFMVILVLPIVLIPGVVEHFRKITLTALVIFLTTMIIDVFNPGSYSTTGVGAAGWVQNPNFAAGAVVALAILAVDWVEYRKADWLVWGVVGGLVVFAGSRSGVIMWVLTVLLWHRHFFRGFYKIWQVITGFLVFSFAMMLIVHYSVGEEYVGTYLADKLRSFTNWDLLVQGERIALISRYLDLIGQAPITGHGAWFWMRSELGAHNIFLMLWASNGILGLVSYLCFILLASYNAYRLSDKRGFVFIVVIFVIQGLFSHMLVIRDLFFVAMTLSFGLAWERRRNRSLAS